MDTVYERENGAEHSESSCSLDLSRSSIIEYCTVLLSIVSASNKCLMQSSVQVLKHMFCWVFFLPKTSLVNSLIVAQGLW